MTEDRMRAAGIDPLTGKENKVSKYIPCPMVARPDSIFFFLPLCLGLPQDSRTVTFENFRIRPTVGLSIKIISNFEISTEYAHTSTHRHAHRHTHTYSTHSQQRGGPVERLLSLLTTRRRLVLGIVGILLVLYVLFHKNWWTTTWFLSAHWLCPTVSTCTESVLRVIVNLFNEHGVWIAPICFTYECT